MYTTSFFVDAKDRLYALKKARKKVRETYPRGIAHIFSVEKQGHQKGRYIIWVHIKKGER